MSIPQELIPFTEPSLTVDSDHPEIQALCASLTSAGKSQLENAIELYYWCRDGIRYNPYSVVADIESFRASHTLATGEGWCVPKSVLLAALCRAAGIPAKLGFADVRNHLSTEQLRRLMQSDVFYYHGYTSVYLEGKWVKATPAFNLSLCERFGLVPLEFNGREDSIYHLFDREGNRHMEYLNDRGQYLDIPFKEMMQVFRQHYPGMVAAMSARSGGTNTLERWEAEVAQETARD